MKLRKAIRKSILPIIILFFVPGYSQKIKPVNDLIEKGYKGFVKSVTEKYIDAIDANNIFYVNESQFNEAGNLTEVIRYNSDKSIDYKMVYTYNAQGGIDTEKRYQGENGSGLRLEYNYKHYYDASKKLIEELHYVASDDGTEVLDEKLTYLYDDSSRIKQLRVIDVSGNQISRIALKYDNAGNKSEVLTYNNEDILMQKEKMEYDRRGNRTDYYQYDETGRLISRHKCSFDGKNNMTMWSSLDASGEVLAKNVYSFNSSGLITVSQAISATNNPDLLKTYSYAFDGKGNWIKKVMSKNNKTVEQVEREIAYYK